MRVLRLSPLVNVVSWPVGSEVANTLKFRSILDSYIRRSVKSYLDQLVPACAHDHRVLRIRRESNARDPIGVTLVGDSIFAVAQSVP